LDDACAPSRASGRLSIARQRAAIRYASGCGAFPPKIERVIGGDLATLQVGWPIGMPLCRSLGGGLWELRSNLPSRRIARLLFFAAEGKLGVVHGFVKKTRKTPAEDIVLARRRMKEMVT
jgi:phage-related protein